MQISKIWVCLYEETKSRTMKSKKGRVPLALYYMILMKGILKTANPLLQIKGTRTAFVFSPRGSCIWVIRLSAILSEIAVERNVRSIPFISGIWPVSPSHRRNMHGSRHRHSQ
jgi:hypothetical protein